MNTIADVVVIGSGIIGASISHELARHGVDSVIAVDKGAGPAEGSTGSSSAFCRCRYSRSELVTMAHEGRELYGDWAAYTGLENPRSELKRPGLVWMLGWDRERTVADAERLADHGVEVSVLDAEGLSGRYPYLNPCGEDFDLTGEIEHECKPAEAFIVEERSGYADPSGANQDLVEAARNRGAEVRFSSPVTGLLRQGDAVSGIELADGSRIDAGLVINAAGPWCNRINEMAEVDLEWHLTPTRVQVIYRGLPPEMKSLPLVGDFSTGIYFRPESEGQQVLVGSVLAEDEEEIVNDPDDFKKSADASYTEMKLAALHHRIPSLEARGLPTGIAGLYTINREDVHPVLGPVGREGFWVANGFSGHGFKLAPVIGSMIAQAYTGETIDRDTVMSMDFFSVDREPLLTEAKNVLA
ncbi:MAG: FAD-dependent oxidoreductase [Acidimicrobiia bacterium]|nr:FAD-dependent oxidoreductase [Acidimicrobiia bacterium]